MVQKSAAFKNYLSDPTVLRTKKSKGIAELMKEFEVSDLTKNLLVVMAENGRLGHTEKVVESFDELLMASRGEVKGTVVSADPLTPEQMKRVKSSITKFLDKGASLKLTEEVDPKILGGLVVSVGDKHIDLSIASRIKKLESLLSEAV